ncbi:hypothetical protein DITRI_Ditri19aG0017700 [Diplodiscus trichospermus]
MRPLFLIYADAAKKFKAIQAWWQDMAEWNCRSVVGPAAFTSYCFTAQKISIDIPRDSCFLAISIGKFVHIELKSFCNRDQIILDLETFLLDKYISTEDILLPTLQSLHNASENAEIVIQSHFRRLIERRNFLKMMKAICLMQTVIRAWLMVKKNSELNKFSFARVQEFPSCICSYQVFWLSISYVTSFSFHFFDLCFARRTQDTWSQHIHGHAHIENASLKCREKGLSNSEIVVAATMIPIAWKNFVCRSLCEQAYAATKIQSHYQCWRLRRNFMKQKQAITKIQSNFRQLKCWRAFQIAWKEFMCRYLENQTFAATKIQCHFGGWQLRKSLKMRKQAIIKIQSNFRRLKCLSDFQQYKTTTKSAIIIQSYVHGWIAQRQACRYRCLIILIQAACEIQRFIRGQITRNRLLGASSLHVATAGSCNFKMSDGFFRSFELTLVIAAVLKLQRWWRGVLLN